MQKKILVSIIALGAFFVTNFASAVANPLSKYPDLNSETSYIDAIEWAINNKIATGYADGNWGPDNCVLRAELVKMVLETKGKAPIEGEKYSTPFPDVKSTDWYFNYANKAKNLGVISGYNDGFFRGWLCVNRAEAMKIATNALLDNPSLDEFKQTLAIYYDDKLVTDIGLNDWYAPYARFLFKNRLIGSKHTVFDGYNENVYPSIMKIKFLPNGDMTRKEVAELLYQIKTSRFYN